MQQHLVREHQVPCPAIRGHQAHFEDNGCGFTPAGAGAAGTHEGMESMRQRMEEIGGQFRLASQPGKGTRAEFLLPFPQTD